jgi:hypothetical protein
MPAAMPTGKPSAVPPMPPITGPAPSFTGAA